MMRINSYLKNHFSTTMEDTHEAEALRLDWNKSPKTIVRQLKKWIKNVKAEERKRLRENEKQPLVRKLVLFMNGNMLTIVSLQTYQWDIFIFDYR